MAPIVGCRRKDATAIQFRLRVGERTSFSAPELEQFVKKTITKWKEIGGSQHELRATYAYERGFHCNGKEMRFVMENPNKVIGLRFKDSIEWDETEKLQLCVALEHALLNI